MPADRSGSDDRARLERRLAQLKSALDSAARQQPISPARPVVTMAGAERDVVVWLADQIRRRVGIAVNQRMKSTLAGMAAGMDQQALAGWLKQLSQSDSDAPVWLSLVEALTVHETYFLRDPGQLDFLRRSALAEVIAREKTAIQPAIRMWSAACSTGEEAYSLALLALEALADAGELDDGDIPSLRRRWIIEIYGSDLSRQAVRLAGEGIYRESGLGSFRNLPNNYWRYFERHGRDAWRVRDEVRRFVRFGQFNLMNQTPPCNNLDVILCRNVIIYFDDPGKRHVFKLVHRALRPGGVAAFGPTDIPNDPTLFDTVWGPAAVIYRKK